MVNGVNPAAVGNAAPAGIGSGEPSRGSVPSQSACGSAVNSISASTLSEAGSPIVSEPMKRVTFALQEFAVVLRKSTFEKVASNDVAPRRLPIRPENACAACMSKISSLLIKLRDSVFDAGSSIVSEPMERTVVFGPHIHISGREAAEVLRKSTFEKVVSNDVAPQLPIRSENA